MKWKESDNCTYYQNLQKKKYTSWRWDQASHASEGLLAPFGARTGVSWCKGRQDRSGNLPRLSCFPFSPCPSRRRRNQKPFYSTQRLPAYPRHQRNWGSFPSAARLLTLSTMPFGARQSSLWRCPVSWRVCDGSSGLCPLDASGKASYDAQNISRCLHFPLRAKPSLAVICPTKWRNHLTFFPPRFDCPTVSLSTFSTSMVPARLVKTKENRNHLSHWCLDRWARGA